MNTAELILILSLFLGAIILSQALDNLTANVAKLSSDVDVLIAKFSGSVPEAAVQAQADAAAAIDAKVVAASQ